LVQARRFSLRRAGALIPQQCPAGFYCSGASAQPIRCSVGAFCPPGSASNITCPAGSYCADITSTPITCPAGYYCLAGTLADCATHSIAERVHPHFSCNLCSTGVTSGVLCPAGTSCPTGAVAMSSCPAGYYCISTVLPPVPCPAGYFCPSVDLTIPIACAPGTAAVGLANRACTPCSQGLFSAISGIVPVIFDNYDSISLKVVVAS
jgi:hypothetical protein